MLRRSEIQNVRPMLGVINRLLRHSSLTAQFFGSSRASGARSTRSRISERCSVLFNALD